MLRVLAVRCGEGAGDAVRRAWMIDLMPRSSVEDTTATKPSRSKLSSPAVHSITPPHMGTIDAYAACE